MPLEDQCLWWKSKHDFQTEDIGAGTMATSPSPSPRNKATETTKPVARKRGKVLTFLRTFLSSRPSKTRLLQAGILKERTFGSDLSEHLVTTGREVPLVLERCTEFIEERGIVDGIYRLSGMTSNIHKLKLLFDDDNPPNLNHENFVRDIHCISSLLKLYFRELPNPLLTHHLYDKFVAAMQMPDEVQRHMAVHHVVQQLPNPHYRTLEYLLRHLSRIAAHGDNTGMTSKNLAIVWAPNLLRPLLALDKSGYALLEVNVQAVTIEYLIRNVHRLFQEGPIALVSSPLHPNSMFIPRQPRLRSSFKVDDSIKNHLAAISVSPSPKLISLEEARAAQRAKQALSRPRSKSVDATLGRGGRIRKQDSIRYCTSIELPVGSEESSADSPNPFGGRRWRSFFARGRHFETGHSVAKIQETDQGTFVSVARETRPVEHEETGSAAVEVIQARGSQEVPYSAPREEDREEEVAVTQHVCLRQVQALRRPFAVGQPVTVCMSQPITVTSTARVRTQPVLSSLNQVTSQQTLFYTTVEYHLSENSINSNSHYRQSSVGSRKHSRELSTEFRPLSVYDNWPSTLPRSRERKCRHSSPVFRSDCVAKPEVKMHRYSSPVPSAPSLLRRAKSHEQILSDAEITVSAPRLERLGFTQRKNVQSH